MSYACPFCRQRVRQLVTDCNVICPKCSMRFYLPAQSQRHIAVPRSTGWLWGVVTILVCQWLVLAQYVAG